MRDMLKRNNKGLNNNRILRIYLCYYLYWIKMESRGARIKNYYALFFCLAITLHNLEEAL